MSRIQKPTLDPNWDNLSTEVQHFRLYRYYETVSEILVTQLRAAIVDIDDWASYADDYFKEKHDLKGTIEQHTEVANYFDENPLGCAGGEVE